MTPDTSTTVDYPVKNRRSRSNSTPTSNNSTNIYDDTSTVDSCYDYHYYKYDEPERLEEDEYDEELKATVRVCKESVIKVKAKVLSVKHGLPVRNRKYFGRELK